MHSMRHITHMKKKLLLIPLTIIASVAVFGSMASANTMQLKMNYGSRQSGDGGEFNASSPDFVPVTMGYAAPTTVNGGFETFCVETNEHFNPGSTYYYGISQAAIHGGIPGGSRSHFQGNGVALPALRYRQPFPDTTTPWTNWQRQRGSPAGHDLVAGR